MSPRGGYYGHPSHCDRCGGAIPPLNPKAVTTGYATTREGQTICYPCADAQCLAEWNATRPGEGFFAYLSGDGSQVVTWPGGFLARVTRRDRTTRYTPTGGRYEWHYIRARDAAGREWYGGGIGPGGYCRMRPRKGQAWAMPPVHPLPEHCPACATERGVAVPAPGTCNH